MVVTKAGKKFNRLKRIQNGFRNDEWECFLKSSDLEISLGNIDV